MDSVVTWKSGMAFDASLDGHHFAIDAAPEHGGQGEGVKPKGLLLTSLAGCTAMDVISILQKMRQNVTAFSVNADGVLATEHPMRYVEITLTYSLTGEGLDTERVKRAVELSQDRYCGVSATLKPSVPMKTVIQVNGETVT